MTVRLISLLLALFLSSHAFSQNAVRDDKPENPQFAVTVDVVNVLVTATDKKGRFITDLAQDDFRVYEDGNLQQITNFSRQTDLPLALALLVDTSSSVSVKLPFEKEAATNFIYSVMRENDKALLVEFDSGVMLLQDFTSSASDIVSKLARLRAGGGTSLYDAISEVTTRKLQNLPQRKIIVVLSDGADQNSKTSLNDILRQVRQANVTVYAVSTSSYGASGDHEGDKALKKLTEETGGKVYFPYTASQMDQHFALINQELRSQYNLAYESSNQKKDGTYRRIEVKTRRDDARLRHKRGYIAPTEGN